MRDYAPIHNFTSAHTIATPKNGSTIPFVYPSMVPITEDFHIPTNAGRRETPKISSIKWLLCMFLIVSAASVVAERIPPRSLCKFDDLDAAIAAMTNIATINTENTELYVLAGDDMVAIANYTAEQVTE
ncbi:hypothetical protein JCM33374_g2470 [Metschnikowia sp. JCM 33374]|nr:hypothetical protein JCM33374_g2470 [Metschnikowia sp. JCM 33374]